MEIYNKIPLIMADVGAVTKDRKNEQQGYSFRGVEDMYFAFNPVLIKHGVFVVPNVLSSKSETILGTNATGKPKTSFRVILTVEHKFYAADGSYVSATTSGEGLDTSDKATSKAMSMAYKYAFMQTFCVPTEDVADGDRQSPTVFEGTAAKAESLMNAFDSYVPAPLTSTGVLGETVISFGKAFKGKTFNEVGAKPLQDYIETTVKYYDDMKKPLPEALANLIPLADEWIGSQMKGNK